MDTEPPAGQTHIDHLQRRSQPGEGEHEVSQTNARRRALVLVLGLLASFAVLWITASAGDRAEAQQNTPASGTVTITGTVGIGELLTAHASGITDADGLTNPNFFLLWLAGATSDPTDATGRLFAYEERYHVLPLDAGLRIMVAVSFYDDAGNLEVIYSVATAVVATVAPAPPSDLTASSTAPGELSLRWQAPSWGIRDWLDERSNVGNGGSDITGYKVQWKLSTGSWNVPADVSEETAAGETHTITNLTGGQTYTLRVIATNEVGDSEPSREITQAVNRQAQPNTPASGTVTITGTVGIGELLTAHASGITDADGLTNPNFFFLWLAGATSDPTDANIRLFAYGERYHVLPLDAGLRIMVGVSFHDDAGNLEAIHSAATAVVATVAPAPPRNLTASSTAPGELSLRWQGPSWSIQDWFDERSNVGNGGSDITGYKVQWKRSTGSWNVPADVSEETAAAETHTNTITNLTGGQTYTLRVIATNGVGDSQPSREITRAVNRFATGAPTITGTPRVGEVLTVDTSGITDEDGLTNPRFAYGWHVAPEPPNDILLRFYNRPGYLVRPVDVGRTIQARVSFIDDANFTEALQSTATTEVAASSPDPPRNLTASPVGGSALNLEWEAPSWTLADWVFNGSSAIGNGGSPITSYTVQWKEGSGSWTNPSDVSSATVTGMTHAITGLIPGVPYSLRVVATNAIGDSTPSPDLTVTVRPPIVITGGGGGGGRSGPTPSDVDFEWNVTRDIEQLDGGNDRATGVWSNGETLWIAENGEGAGDAVYAYDLASGERQQEREFELDERNRAPRGVWSDRTTIWVSDSGQNRLFAHNLESGERLPERDIALAERNRDARGIWSDGETMWVLDSRADALFAYALASGELLAEYALDSANDDPHGIWSDGVGVWVSNHDPKRLFAYRLPVLPDAETDSGEEDADDDPRELERVRNEEFSKLSRAGNNSPRGIWSDGDVMYVADANDDRVYSYNMPDAIDARLASLTLSGVDIGEFDPGRPDYEAVVADGVTETTVEAEAMQRRTDVAIDPPDADGDDANGHQVALQDLGEITVTVTSQDGSRTKVYRVQFPETGWDPARDPWPHCLRGAISEGFSLVVYEGGSVEELVSCAESRGIVALYALHEGVYVSHILGAPDFVNAGFLELFPDGLPSITPLVAGSNGPPSADPFGDGLEGGGQPPWPECLRGTVVAGFSLVVYEGGSVDELEACARSRDVAALYALSEGEFVSYILGAPDFVTQPFRDLFADGLPLMTPLVGRSEGLPGGR